MLAGVTVIVGGPPAAAAVNTFGTTAGAAASSAMSRLAMAIRPQALRARCARAAFIIVWASPDIRARADATQADGSMRGSSVSVNYPAVVIWSKDWPCHSART